MTGLRTRRTCPKHDGFPHTLRLTVMGVMRLADTHPEPGFPILPVRSGIDPERTAQMTTQMGEAGRKKARLPGEITGSRWSGAKDNPATPAPPWPKSAPTVLTRILKVKN
jgi:hypothetical protein